MENANLLLTEPISPPAILEHLDKPRLNNIAEAKKEQAAKDFESVLLNKLLDEMKNTIGDWGLEKNAATKQVQGIFWLYLARDIANNGGLGLWKDIHQSLKNAENINTVKQSVDGKL